VPARAVARADRREEAHGQAAGALQGTALPCSSILRICPAHGFTRSSACTSSLCCSLLLHVHALVDPASWVL
jgi:hypothetical protein